MTNPPPPPPVATNRNDEELNAALHIDPYAEQYTIGALLIDPSGIYAVRDGLRPDMFATGFNKIIYTAMLDLADKGLPADPITLSDRVRQLGYDITAATFITYIENIPNSFYVEHYAAIVAKLADKRSLVAAAGRISELTYKDLTPVEMRDQAITLVTGAVANRADAGWTTLGDALGRALTNLEPENRIPAIPTGFAQLDTFLGGGLKRKRSYCLCGRPAMGKSVLAAQIALNMAIAGYRVAFFSLEMSDEDLALRFLSSMTGIDGLKLQAGNVNEDEKILLNEAAGELYGLPLKFNPYGEDVNMFSAIRQLSATEGLDAVFVDYIQLVEVAGNQNRNDAIGTVTRRLKLGAMALDYVAVPVSQMNRTNEKQADKRPELSHLRDSGNIEQDQDGVLGIYREDYYNPKTADRGTAEILLLKHRFGPTGKVKMGFNASLTKFL